MAKPLSLVSIQLQALFQYARYADSQLENVQYIAKVNHQSVSDYILMRI